MSENLVDYKTRGGVAYISLNRPEKLNAITIPMTLMMLKRIDAAANDPEVRVIVFRGEGRAFSAGADHKEMDDLIEKWRKNPFAYIDYLRSADQKLVHTIRKLEKPTIAAVNGYAIGVGSGIAYACDFRIASTEAKFQESFVRIGLAPGEGAISLLASLVGFSRATQMILTGEIVGAEEAYRIGLVAKVVPPNKLDAEVEALAGKLIANAPLALRAAKAGLNRMILPLLEDDLERAAFVLYALKNTPDAKEALRAFLEKRQAKFSGS